MAAATGANPDDGTEGLSSLDSADFVRIFVAPTAEAIAAAGLIVARLDVTETPFHASVGTATPAADATTVAIGRMDAHDDVAVVRPESVIDAIDAEGSSRDTAGLVATIRWATTASKSDQTGQLGLPTEDWQANLQSSTLVRGPFSGEGEEPTNWIAAHENYDDRSLRSAITLSTLEAHPTIDMAKRLQPFLAARSVSDGPFVTDAGTFDILDVLSARHPGLALAVCCNHERERDVAVTTWRRESTAVHAVIDQAIADGTLDAGEPITATDAPLAPTARLVRTLRADDSPVVVTDGTTVAVAAVDPTELDEQLEAPVYHGDGRVVGTIRRDLNSVLSAAGVDHP